MPLFPSVFKLADLDGDNGFTIGSSSIHSIASAGDVNGDGFDDIIVGLPYTDHGQGTAYVVFGTDQGFPTDLTLSSLDGTNGFKIENTSPDHHLGMSVAGAGDINGDGFADLIVSAPIPSSNPYDYSYGASYVVFGTDSGFDATIDVADLDGANGFAIDAPFPFVVSTVAGAGDVNGDGFDDLILGVYGLGPYNEALTYVVFGTDAGFPAHIDPGAVNGDDGFLIRANGSFMGLGTAAGDVNGDGNGDLIVAGNHPGQAYVVFGQTSFYASIDVSDLDGSNGFALTGIDGLSGIYGDLSVASAGDVNGDGFDDVIVGSYYASPNGKYSGASYVVFGKASGFAANIDVSTLDGTNGFKIDGVAKNNASGISVAGAGDVNGDGFDDILIGAPGTTTDGIYAGSAYVLFGKASGFAAEVQLASLNGDNGFRIDGVSSYDGTGLIVASAGDVNNDGYSDILVGSDEAGVSVVLGGMNLSQIAPEAPFIRNTTIHPNGSVTIEGLAQALADIDFTEGGSSIGSTSANADGTWAFTSLPLSDTVHDITVSASNAAGSSDHNGNVIVGTTGDDNLTAEPDYGPNIPRPTVIMGREGNDTLTTSAGGGDTLIAASGGDSLLRSTGTGDNTLIGGTGTDTLIAVSSGYDVLQGGTGDNLLLARGGEGEMHSGSLAGGHNVLIDESNHSHKLYGGLGNDSLYASGTGGDTLYAGGGDNLLQTVDGSNYLYGGTGADTLVSGSSDHGLLFGDLLFGGTGNNLLLAKSGAGPGRMYSGSLAGGYNVLIDESSSNHTLYGGLGNDTLYASGTGTDLLFAGDGNNVLRTVQGSNYLWGNGDDTLIAGSSGSDELTATGGNNLLLALAGSGSGTLSSTSYDLEANVLINQSLAQHTLYGGAGLDSLYAGGGGDILYTGGGSNMLMGGAGDDLFVHDNGGNATLSAAGGGHDTIDASASSGINLFYLGFGNEEVLGGSGFNYYDDYTSLGTGGDRTINITAGTVNDILHFEHRSNSDVTSDGISSPGIRTIVFNDNKTYNITDSITVEFTNPPP